MTEPSKPGLTPERSQRLHRWMQLSQQVRELTEQERSERKELAAELFGDPKEGTSKLDLGAGWTLEAVMKYNRPLDSAALPAVLEELRRLELSKIMVSVDALVKYTPEISVSELRKIEKAQMAEAAAGVTDGPGHKAMELLAQVMTVKPGLPSFKVLPPKDEK